MATQRPEQEALKVSNKFQTVHGTSSSFIFPNTWVQFAVSSTKYFTLRFGYKKRQKEQQKKKSYERDSTVQRPSQLSRFEGHFTCLFLTVSSVDFSRGNAIGIDCFVIRQAIQCLHFAFGLIKSFHDADTNQIKLN